jgi:hypothetical protein
MGIVNFLVLLHAHIPGALPKPQYENLPVPVFIEFKISNFINYNFNKNL